MYATHNLIKVKIYAKLFENPPNHVKVIAYSGFSYVKQQRASNFVNNDCRLMVHKCDTPSHQGELLCQVKKKPLSILKLRGGVI